MAAMPVSFAIALLPLSCQAVFPALSVPPMTSLPAS
jgi:hypothetical protein